MGNFEIISIKCINTNIIFTTTWDVQGPAGVNVSGTDGAPGGSALH